MLPIKFNGLSDLRGLNTCFVRHVDSVKNAYGFFGSIIHEQPAR